MIIIIKNRLSDTIYMYKILFCYKNMKVHLQTLSLFTSLSSVRVCACLCLLVCVCECVFVWF